MTNPCYNPRKSTLLKGGVDLRGGIYSDQRCSVCNSKFRDNGKALVCPDHPEQKAITFRVKYQELCRRFTSYKEAQAVLFLWRGKSSEGTFDAREYRENRPLAISSMGKKFVEMKEVSLRPKTLENYQRYFTEAETFFDDIVITRIGFAELEDYHYHLTKKFAPATSQAAFKALLTLLRWAKKRKEISDIPEIPERFYQIPMRKVLTKQSQAAVLNRIFERWGNRDRRVCIGIQLLATYPKIRPRELRDVKEKHLDLNAGIMVIENPKAAHEPKFVRLLPEDIEMIKTLPRGFPEMYFLRYERTGRRFGPNRLTTVWLKACRDLGISGVCLYSGTKHSTVSDLAKIHPSRLLEKAAGISERALRRYAVLQEEDCVDLYRQARPDTVLTPDFGHHEKVKSS